MRLVVAVLAAAILLGACSADSTAGDTSLTGEAAALQEARERWERADIDDYRWTFRRLCFCPPLRVRVDVVDGRAQEPTVLEGDQTETDVDFLTMEDLFAEIEEDIEVADEVSADYDPETGAVIRVRSDHDLDATDDELEWHVDRFVPA